MAMRAITAAISLTCIIHMGQYWPVAIAPSLKKDMSQEWAITTMWIAQRALLCVIYT